MTRFACLDQGNQLVWPERFRHFDARPPDPVGKGWRIVPAPEALRPVSDPATQTVEGPFHAIGADSVSETYVVLTKSPAEIAAEVDADREAQLDAIQRVLLRLQFNHENRLRAMESTTAEPKPPLTPAQFRAAIKALL